MRNSEKFNVESLSAFSKPQIQESNHSYSLADSVDRKSKANVKFKDSVFCKIFSDKEALLDLYKELLYDDPDSVNATVDDLNIITLDNALVNDYYNDIGFIVKDRLIVLVEEQSTLCYNMPMRLLIYIAREYEQYVNSKNYKLHGVKQYKFPAPKFFVISINKNGPDEMRLSDCFNVRSTALELVVPIIKESDGGSLASYLNFARDVKANYRKGMNLENVIRDCLERVDGDDRAAQLIRKEGVNMTSLFEKAFDYDEMVNDLKISYEQLAEEKVLVSNIQNMRDFGITDNQIRAKLLEKHSAQQVDEAFAKVDSGE